MLFALFLLLVAACVLPSFWVRRVMKRHGEDRPDLPGTGGELARHLIETFKLEGVRVERLESDQGDHYDPTSRTLRLARPQHDGRSVTAVAVAAHEFGHALQHAERYEPLMQRHKLVPAVVWVERVGIGLLGLAPLLFLVAPKLALVQGLAAFAVMGGRVLVHLVTLPVEHDASFNRALPILRAGGYLRDDDLSAATTVLRAAAYTYVAGALMTLVNIVRWFRVLR